MLLRVGGALAILFALTGNGPVAWAGKVGPEFRVNTFTAGRQQTPSVARLGNGAFVVAWASEGQDGSGWGVYGQRYSAAGARVGGEFRVNTTTYRSQWRPSVAGLSGGGFVVVWESDLGWVDQEYFARAIYGQRYDAAGARVGSEFQVTTDTTRYEHYRPSVAGLSNGGFVVTWTAWEVDFGADIRVQGRRYSAGGAGGGVFQVNTTVLDHVENALVAALNNGRFAIIRSTWLGGGRIYREVFHMSGARAGGELHFDIVSSSSLNNSIASLKSGGFVVGWDSNRDAVPNRYDVFARRFSATGVPVRNEFRVNTHTASDQYNPSIAGMSDGGFVVAWTSKGSQDGSGLGVFAQRYNAAGVRIGGEFRVNTRTFSTQWQPSVAALNNGAFVVIWSSYGHDGSTLGIYGQRFVP